MAIDNLADRAAIGGNGALHRPPPPAPRVKLRPKEFRPSELLLLVVAGVAAISIVWIVFEQLTLLSGTFGFIVCTIVVYLGLYWTVCTLIYGRRVAADRLVAVLVALGALCMFTPLVLLIVYLFIKGVGLLSFHLLVSTQKGVPEFCIPGTPCPKAGVFHAIVGTVEQIALAAAMGVPAAILTAVFLSEVGGWGSRSVRVVVTAMSGVPAIVAGVFIYSFWIVTFHQGFSGFAGSLALAVLLLPTITRGTEEVLKIVPNDLPRGVQGVGGTGLAHHVVSGAPDCPLGSDHCGPARVGGRTG